MASPGVQQQPLVPFIPTRDCSQGVCSVYCPQWCYSIFPPPPPLGFFSDDSSSSNASLSPFIIALIGILASAFLVASYYIFVSRYCGGLSCLRRRSGGQDTFHGAPAEDSEVLRGDRWQQPPPAAAGGLEEWIIRRIAVCRYKKGDGLVESGDCAVCLGEFRDGESLRLLPDCLHAFHVSCIDTWLKSHSSCPICRANIVYTFAPPSSTPNPPPRRTPTPQPRSAPPVPEIRQDPEIAVQDRGGGEEISGLENAGAVVRKWRLRIYRESANLNGPNGPTEVPEEGIRPDAPRRSSGSNPDVLQQEVEGGLPTRGVRSVAEEVGSSRTFRMEQHACKGGGSDHVLHCIMSPAPVKGSFAGGRFWFPGQGKGNNESILPL